MTTPDSGRGPAPRPTFARALGRVLAVFTAPGPAMLEVRARPAVLVALVLAFSVAFLSGLVSAPSGVDLLIDQIYASSELDAAQRESFARSVEEHETLVQVLMASSGAVAMLVSVLVWAVLLHAGTSMTFAERPPDLRFQHSLAVASHANLVNVPSYVILAILHSSGRSLSTTLSLAGLLGLSPSSPLGVAAAWLSPFNLWWIALLGIGVAVAYRIRLAHALAVPLFISLGLRALQVAMAGIGSGMSQVP